MTLKEKFNDLVPKEFGGMQEPLLTDCEQIADDYAIEFAEWCNDNFLQILGKNLWTKSILIEKTYNAKELLEIFKKEKGL